MDGETDPDDEHVTFVLAQELSRLSHLLRHQPPAVMARLRQMMPSQGGRRPPLTSSGPPPPSSSSSEVDRDEVAAMLDYFLSAAPAECCAFVQSVCLLCADVPVDLDCRLMAAAANPLIAGGRESVSSSAADETRARSPSPPQRKRPRIDHWEHYVAAVRRLLISKWQRRAERLLRDVQLENVWVSPRTASRGRERPDQTPGSADRESRTPGRTPERDGDLGGLESRVTLEVFLQGRTGKVTVLTGRAGSGKTVLTSCLGQQWANRLGPVPSSFLFVLLEFRQLNLLLLPLSLSELLFQIYLPPEGGDVAKRTILKYLLANPEQSCWVLDGFDEFHCKLGQADQCGEPLDLENRLPVADLVAGLLNRRLLPGSTVLVTCRLRDVSDLDGVSDRVGELVGWGHLEIQEYVQSFFGLKGRSATGTQAAQLLFSSRHFLAMSSLPALCNICCICLDHLLPEGQNPEGIQGGERRTRGPGKEGLRGAERRKEERGVPMMDGTNGREELLVPNTLTQVYLTVLGAFLSRNPGGEGERGGGGVQEKTTRFLLSSLRRHQALLCDLSCLAWRGLKENRILFREDDVSQDVLEFSLRTGIFYQVELRSLDGTSVSGVSFIHLTLQEFFAALRVMTSDKVKDAQLKKSFILKTRWTNKSNQRTVFTDSLYLFVCGLASPQCTPALVQLTQVSGLMGVQNWVQGRQQLVLNLLKTLCKTNKLTGPKILELCHCVQESQDQQLAQQVVDTTSTLELRNIPLLPNDIEALAFVVNSASGDGVGLDFGACTMDLECLDVLSRCRNIHNLSFRGRKYSDQFAQKLSSILLELKALRKLEFCGASLTAAGAASLTSGLLTCPHLTQINLSDNNLKDEGIKHVAQIFTRLHNLNTVTLGRNNTSLTAVEYLIEKMTLCLNIQHVHADGGTKELSVTFCEGVEDTRHKTKPAPSISLLKQKWSKTRMQKLAKFLAKGRAVSVVDLSGGLWNENVFRTMIQLLPKFNVTKKILVNDSCSSVDSLVLLTELLSARPSVVELRVRLLSPVQVSIRFAGGTENPDRARRKVLCLSSCNLLPSHLERIWNSLGTSSALTELDLSCNRLGNQGLKKLLDFLPRLSQIEEINAGSNAITAEGVATLAGALCARNKLAQIHISGGGADQVVLRFCSDRSLDKTRLKTFRMSESSLSAAEVTALCRNLSHCRSPLHLQFVCSSMTMESVHNLLQVLPDMTTLQKLDVSHSVASTEEGLVFIGCLTNNQRVASVELRPDSDSFIEFLPVKAECASCRLTHFHLKGADMERLLEILQQGPRLSDLDLSSNQLGDEEVKTLVDFLPMLKISRYVNLSSNSLSQQGLLEVARALCTCTEVSGVDVSLGEEQRCVIWFSQSGAAGKTLSVAESSLGHEHLVRLAQVASSCPSLDKLELRNNSLQPQWIQDAVRQLESSRRGLHVSVEERWMGADGAVQLLRDCVEVNRNIQTIRIDHSTMHLTLRASQLTSNCDDDDDAETLRTEKIGLAGRALDGRHLASLVRILQRCRRSLTQLDLSYTSLGGDGLHSLTSFLPSLPNLTTLSVVCKGESVAAPVAALQTATVQHLNLSGSSFSESSVLSFFSSSLAHLRSLDLSHCVWSGAAGLHLMEALQRHCEGLEALCLDSVLLNEDGRKCLAGTLRTNVSIRRLRLNKLVCGGPLDSDVLQDLLPALEGLAQLEELQLDGWRMDEGGTDQLSRLVPAWSALRKIVVSKNLMSDESGQKLLQSLKSCTRLQELHLSRNCLGDLTAAQMCLILPSLTHLSVLDMSENRLGSEGAAGLSRAVACMTNLSKLHLTSVGTSQLRAVAASLSHCPLIQDVSLGWNKCGDEVMEELVRVLPLCHKLSRIDLESNSVTASGAEMLLRPLRACPALRVIRLWKNNISPSDALRLSEADRRLNFSPT